MEVEEDVYEYPELYGVELPHLDFNLSFLAGQDGLDRDKKCKLVHPKAHPNFDWSDVGYSCDQCSRGMHHFSNTCCYCCIPTVNLPAAHEKLKAFTEIYSLKDRRSKRRKEQQERRKAAQNDIETGQILELDEPGEEIDGIYQDELPLLTPILLRGEAVNPAITPLTTQNITLSRITQRILREIIALREKGFHSDESNPFYKSYTATVEMLDRQDESPIFKLSNDPWDYSYSRLVVEDPNHDEAGQVTQWSQDSSIVQKYGPLPGSFHHHSTDGTLMRLFLYQAVLSEHPYINGEERLYASMKETFSQYSAVFEQKALEYLAERIQTLSKTMQDLITLKRELFDEEKVQLQHCYKELLELLPLLSDYCRKIHSLTMQLTTAWKDLKEVRRRQTYSTTPGLLRVRKLTSNLSVPSTTQGVRPSTRGNAPKSDLTWEKFCELLSDLPVRFKQAQVLLRLVRNEQTLINQQGAEGKDDGGGGAVNRRSHQQAPSNFSQLTSSSDEAMERELQIITKTTNELKQSAGLVPAFALQLSEGSPMTAEGLLPEIERKRRKDLKSLKYRLQVRVNGQVVQAFAHSEILDTSFVLDIRKYYELRLLRMPQDVTVDIYCSMPAWSSVTDQFISSIHIPIPGAHTPTLASSNTRKGGSIERYFTHAVAPRFGGFSFISDLLPAETVLSTCLSKPKPYISGRRVAVSISMTMAIAMAAFIVISKPHVPLISLPLSSACS